MLAAGGAGPDGYYSPGERLLTVPGTCDRSTRRHVLDWLQSSVALPAALLRRSHGGCCMCPVSCARLCCVPTCWHEICKPHTWACSTRLPRQAAQLIVVCAVIHDVNVRPELCTAVSSDSSPDGKPPNKRHGSAHVSAMSCLALGFRSSSRLLCLLLLTFLV